MSSSAPPRRQWFSASMRVYRASAVAVVVLALLCLVCVVVALFSLRTARQVQTDTVRIVGSADAVIIDLLNAETGQRGFLLTQNGAYLQPLIEGTNALPGDLQRLDRASADMRLDPAPRRELRRIVDAKFDELQETTRLARRGQETKALDVVNTSRGKPTMDQARAVVAGLQESARQAGNDRRVHATLLLRVSLALGAAVLVAVVVLLTLMRSRLRTREEAEWDFQEVFDSAPVGMAVVGLEGAAAGRLTNVNEQFASLLGLPVERVDGRDLSELTHPQDRPLVTAAIRRLTAGETQRGVGECRLVACDGSPTWVSMSYGALRTGAERSAVLQVVDVTARRDAEEKLIRLAHYDALTGLPNRTLLREHLAKALDRGRRSGTCVAVLFVDLDDFKAVNDDHGHAVGDALLVEVAARLRGTIRASDLAARLGGDEFVVVCDGIACAPNPQDASLDGQLQVQALVRRMQDAVRGTVLLGNRRIELRASVGLALADVEEDADAVLRRADAAMYTAKGDGKGRLVTSFEDARLAGRRSTLTEELRAALDRDELRLLYQPVVDLASSRVVSIEALLRWQHPQRGLLPPGEFLDVAEAGELMAPVGEWVLRTACTEAQRWRNGWGAGAPSIAVNVAAGQLSEADFPDVVRGVLAETGLPADRLILEVTERQVLEAAEPAQDSLRALRDGQVRIALDDFGTGYSTFEYLRTFPFDMLKIDRSFVSRLGADDTDDAIVRALLHLSDSLDLTVVAEGIETARQADVLEELGCERAQGYHFHRPQEPAAIEALLERSLVGVR